MLARVVSFPEIRLLSGLKRGKQRGDEMWQTRHRASMGVWRRDKGLAGSSIESASDMVAMG